MKGNIVITLTDAQNTFQNPIDVHVYVEEFMMLNLLFLLR